MTDKSERGPEMQRLIDRLYNDPTRKTLHFAIDAEPGTPAEVLAAEINHALDAIERGDCELIHSVDGRRERSS